MAWVALGALGLRLLLSTKIPMTGDEAYFVAWGQHPALGYYDHPPMIGWLETLLRPLGLAPWSVRLPATLCFFVIIALSLRLLKRQGVSSERAHVAGLVMALAPLPFFYSIVTTDTPLIFFSFIATYFYLEALRTKRIPTFAAAGVALGLAFLSKYFAVFLGVTFAVWILIFERSRRNVGGLAVLLLAVLPFAALNLYWNYTHAWMTLLFNFQTRLNSQSFGWKKPLSFALMQFYLATPVLLVALWTQRKALRIALQESALVRRLGFLFVFPITVFGLNSFKVSIGFHWSLSFYAVFYLFAALVLPWASVRRTTVWLAAFTALHLLIFGVIATVPAESWQSKRMYRDYVFHSNLPLISAELRPFVEHGVAVASTGYTPAALLAQDGRFPVRVFLSDSHYGRANDLWDDWQSLDGKSLVIFSVHAPQKETLEPYFKSLRRWHIEIAGMDYHFVEGMGFKYAEYRKFLEVIEKKFYTPPTWLPFRRPDNLLR